MNKQHDPPFAPVAKRRSAVTEDAPTQQYPGLRTSVGYIRNARNFPPVAPANRQTIEGEDEEQQYAYADSPRRAKTTVVYRPAKPTRRLERPRFHWLVFVGLAMFIMILGWLTFSALSSWWQVTQDDWHYGRPRTYQTDAVVGHEDSASHPSHFIAVNLKGQILVIEVPRGNASKAQIYIGPRLFGAGQDLVPVTLSFEDCNGDGKPDLNIHIAGSDKIICFVNNGKTFTTTQQQ